MLGYVSKDQVHIACEKIMLVQRDFGDRTNRKHARLKYTIDDLGVDVFKAKVEELLGYKFDEPRPFKIESNIDYFGWCKDELDTTISLHSSKMVELKIPQNCRRKLVCVRSLNS